MKQQVYVSDMCGFGGKIGILGLGIHTKDKLISKIGRDFNHLKSLKLGPKTVVEMFTGTMLDGEMKVYTNSSDIQGVTVDCDTFEAQSLNIWNFDRYNFPEAGVPEEQEEEVLAEEQEEQVVQEIPEVNNNVIEGFSKVNAKGNAKKSTINSIICLAFLIILLLIAKQLFL